MGDSAPYSNGGTGDDSGVRAGRGGIMGTPRWVMVFGIILAIVVVLFVVVVFLGGGSLGGHGPGRHSQSRDSGGQAPPSGITAVQVPLAAVAGQAPLEGGPR
jgi:hypothetical protein